MKINTSPSYFNVHFSFEFNIQTSGILGYGIVHSSLGVIYEYNKYNESSIIYANDYII